MIYFAKLLLPFLLRPSPISKCQTVWAYVKIALIDGFKLPSKRVRMFGWTVSFSSVKSLRYLYEEIFLEEHYRPYAPIGRSSTIVDGGANIGLATLYFKLLFPTARVVCFEPHPVTFRILCNNLARNKIAGVEVHERALAAEAREYRLVGADLIARLNPKGSEADRSHGEMVTVKSCPLSMFVRGRQVDLLKLDVEGSEVMVLDELGANLKGVKQIVLEYHRWAELPRLSAVLALLEAHGHEYEVRFWSEAEEWGAATCIVRSRTAWERATGLPPTAVAG